MQKHMMILRSLQLGLVLIPLVIGCSRDKTGSGEAARPAGDSITLPAGPAAGPPAPAASQPQVYPMMRTDRVDFSLPLKPVTDTARFSAYAGKQLLVFYFGATCSHCQAAFPEVQAFAESLRARGYEAVAIAASRSTPEEIEEFITDYKCRLPVFWDSERLFGDAYDVKMFPTFYLIRPDGSFFRHEGFEGKPTLALLGSKV